MTASGGDPDCWFDTSALVAAPRRKKPLEAISSVLPGRQLSDAQQEALVAFAAANDLHYISWLAGKERMERLPSLVLDDVCVTLVTGPKPHLLEFGNHGWRFWKHESDGTPSRRGYIAIRHGLGLPHLYLDSCTPRAATVLGVASAAMEVAGAFDLERTTVDLSAVDRFKEHATELDPAPPGFRAYVETGSPAVHEDRLSRAAALLDEPDPALLTALATGFDLEVTDDWIFAYSNRGEISTLDPQTWAWAFGAASRLFDLLAVWGAEIAGVQDQAWYTADSVEVPAGTPGVLQKLAPARRTKVGKFLLGTRDE